MHVYDFVYYFPKKHRRENQRRKKPNSKWDSDSDKN